MLEFKSRSMQQASPWGVVGILLEKPNDLEEQKAVLRAVQPPTACIRTREALAGKAGAEEIHAQRQACQRADVVVHAVRRRPVVSDVNGLGFVVLLAGQQALAAELAELTAAQTRSKTTDPGEQIDESELRGGGIVGCRACRCRAYGRHCCGGVRAAAHQLHVVEAGARQAALGEEVGQFGCWGLTHQQRPLPGQAEDQVPPALVDGQRRRSAACCGPAGAVRRNGQRLLPGEAVGGRWRPQLAQPLALVEGLAEAVDLAQRHQQPAALHRPRRGKGGRPFLKSTRIYTIKRWACITTQTPYYTCNLLVFAGRVHLPERVSAGRNPEPAKGCLLSQHLVRRNAGFWEGRAGAAGAARSRGAHAGVVAVHMSVEKSTTQVELLPIRFPQPAACSGLVRDNACERAP